jgi:hypothetical protein
MQRLYAGQTDVGLSYCNGQYKRLFIFTQTFAMRLPITPALVSLLLWLLPGSAAAQKFYVETLDFKAPYLSKTLVLDLTSCDTAEIYTCPPTQDTGLGPGLYTDMAIDHKQNLWYVTQSGNLYRRNLNNDSSCEYIGDFTLPGSWVPYVNALVADDGNALYAAGANSQQTALYKLEYTEDAIVFSVLGHLPPGWLSAGDLFFYEHRLFLSCSADATNKFLVEVSLPDPSASCIYMDLNGLSAYGAFSTKTAQGSKAYIVNAFANNYTASLAEIDIPNKKVLSTLCNYPYLIGGAATYYDLVDDTTTCLTGPPISVNTVASQTHGFKVLNPSSHYIRITTNIISDEVAGISLYDFSGRRVKDFSGEDFPERLNIADVPPGLYMLGLRLIDGKLSQHKLVVSP